MRIAQHKTFIEGHRFEEIMGNIIPKIEPKIHLSHGLNDLPIPQIMKDVMIKDIETEGFRRYGDLNHDRLLCSLITHHHNLLTRGEKLPWGHCNVIESATYALNCVLQYIHTTKQRNRPIVLVVGLNYYLIYEILNQIGFKINNLFSEESNSPQPSTEKIIFELNAIRPDVLILSQPSNPSGEIIAAAENI